jgi:hypothetical protein
MKKLCLLGASVLAALTISACSVSVGGEGTFKLEGDDLEGAQSVLDVYFEETLKQTNMTVTLSLGTDAQFKEEIDGTSDFTAFGSEANSYSFVDGTDRYIYAYTPWDEVETVYYIQNYDKDNTPEDLIMAIAG